MASSRAAVHRHAETSGSGHPACNEQPNEERRPAGDLSRRALAAAETQARWLESYGDSSWDTYDFWANDWGRRAKRVYYIHKSLGTPLVAPFALLDWLAPRSRAFFWHRQRFPIADAHYAMGFCHLAAADSSGRWLARAVHSLEALVESRCPGETEYCWGYPFDWETCFGTWRTGTPLITSTPYGYEAFALAHELTGAPECLAIMASVARFADARIGSTVISPGVVASTYTPNDRRRVVNASAYRGFLLAAAGRQFTREDWLAKARTFLAFVLQSQHDDGSWYYAMDGRDAFIDNFHTCFVLKNLYKSWVILDDDVLLSAVRRGYDFYKASLLDQHMLPLPFAKTQRLSLLRRDLYDYAEGLNLALLLRDIDTDARTILRAILDDLLTRWQLSDGHFVSRELIGRRSAIPYHRWAQAQTFRSLTLVATQGID